jgi:hypothetical protein
MNIGQERSLGLPARQTPLTGLRDEKKAKTQDALVKAIGDSRNILVRATTVFPFTLFPDTITIDRAKLTITHRDFFSAGEALSINIEDILNVTATVGPFFGSIMIATRFFDPGKPYTIDKFHRADALKIKRIAQGYIIAKQKDIDCTALSNQELTKLLDELGKVDAAEKL